MSRSLSWSHSPVGHQDHSHHKEYSPNPNLSRSNDIHAHLGLNGSSQAWGGDNNGTRKRRKKHSMSESSLESPSWKWQSVLASFHMGMGLGSPWFRIHEFYCMYWKIIGEKVSWSLETGYLGSQLQPTILCLSTSCIVGAHINKSGEDGSFASLGKSLFEHKKFIVVRCGTRCWIRCWMASFLNFVWNIWCSWLRQWQCRCKMHVSFFSLLYIVSLDVMEDVVFNSVPTIFIATFHIWHILLFLC